MSTPEQRRLYERVKHGDQQTFVVEFKKGETISFADDSTLTFKTRVKLPVTKEWDNKRKEWLTKSYQLEKMVDAEEERREQRKKAAPIPEVRLVRPGLWERIKNIFLKEV